MNECIQRISHSQIKFEEKQSQFILLNPEHKIVDYITVDGCIYDKGSANLRCDYALNHNNTTVFIELKGSDITHAIKQILATKQDAKFAIKPNKVAVVITRKMPKDDSSLRAQKIQLKNNK